MDQASIVDKQVCYTSLYTCLNMDAGTSNIQGYCSIRSLELRSGAMPLAYKWPGASISEGCVVGRFL